MKYCLMCLCIWQLTACSNYVSSEEMNKDVKIVLQQQLDHRGELKNYEISVKDLDLTKKSDDVYEGISTLEYNGADYKVDLLVLVTSDGNYIVNIPNEDFSFIDDLEIERYRAQLEKEFQSLVSEIDQQPQEKQAS
jgi:hypothetical protein